MLEFKIMITDSLALIAAASFFECIDIPDLLKNFILADSTKLLLGIQKRYSE